MNIVKRISSTPDTIYLTFDDGPSCSGTEAVLRRLSHYGVQATFFVIVNQLKQEESLLRRIQTDGHAIGNHSYDHLYRNYFKGNKAQKIWLDRSEEGLRQSGIQEWVGFRSPAGILPPPLWRELKRRNEPYIYWSERFYDGVWPWTHAKAKRSLQRLSGGEIVLLHDVQPKGRVEAFCSVLDAYIEGIQSRGFKLARLTREHCLEESRLSLRALEH